MIHADTQHASYFPKYSPPFSKHHFRRKQRAAGVFGRLDHMTGVCTPIISRHCPHQGMRRSDNRHILAIMEELHGKRKF